jgi:hypothetical protein
MTKNYAWLLITCLLGLAQWAPAEPGTAGPIHGEPIGGSPPADSPLATNSPLPSVVLAGRTATNAAALPGKTVALAKDGKFPLVGFDLLSRFNFEGSDSAVKPENAAEAARKSMAQVPAAVRALNDKPVAIQGFMLPMKVEDGKVTEFLLLKSQMGCCYGLTPGINEWVDVRTIGKGVESLMDNTITVYGTLHVGEVRENGYLTGLYKMDCEKVQPVTP